MKNTFDFFLFDSEAADDVYNNSLESDYWDEIRNKFPKYNSVNTQDHIDAVEYILKKMKDEYDNIEWTEIEAEIRNKIADGIS